MSEPTAPKPELEWQLPANRDRIEDAFWAKHDEATRATYPGLWVVAVRRQVVASGRDVDEVRRQAAEKTGEPLEELIATYISDDNWVAHG